MMPNNDQQPTPCPDCGQPMELRGQWGWICFKCREQFDNWYESQLTDDQSTRIQSNWESSKAFIIWTQDKWIDEAFTAVNAKDMDS